MKECRGNKINKNTTTIEVKEPKWYNMDGTKVSEEINIKNNKPKEHKKQHNFDESDCFLLNLDINGNISLIDGDEKKFKEYYKGCYKK